MTLDRLISRFGLASRKVAVEWIRSGRVRVNRRVERDALRWVHISCDQVEIDGREISEVKKQYILLNKPAGVITSYGDPEQRRTVYECLSGLNAWVFPVGRLDKDTSGLLLLTNDTEFGNHLTDPDSKVAKKYLVKVNGLLTPDEIEHLRQGVEIEPGVITRPCRVARVRQTAKYDWLEMTLTEGKNRQIRRMMEALEYQVLKLVRIQIGDLELGELMVGRWRNLTRQEVNRLMTS